MIGDIAATFHFAPSEIWAMETDEVRYWHGQALRVGWEREGS